MESFAPAYFDYMSSAVSANVRIFHCHGARKLIRHSDQRYLRKSSVATS